MKATMRRALIAAAFGVMVVAGSLGLGTSEAQARVQKPIMLGPCSAIVSDTSCLH